MIGLAVFGVLALVILIVAVSSGDDDGDGQTVATVPETTESPATSAPDDTAATPTETDPDDGDSSPTEGIQDLGDGVVLLESGFSTVPALDGRTRSSSVGIVIKNTGDEVRSGFSLTWTLYDDSGAVLEDRYVDAFTLQPDEELGIGYLGLGGVDGEPAELEIQPTGELPLPGGTDASGSVTVSNIESTMDSSTGFVTTTFEAESSYPDDLINPLTHVIYRDSAGDIVGGKLGGSPGPLIPDSSIMGQVESGADLSELDIDLDQTEVYIDPAYQSR